MGFFDIFRRKKEPEMPEALAKVYKLFFPEGREQQVYLTSQLSQKLGNRYNEDVVANNYIFVLTCLFMDEDKTLSTITGKVKRRINNQLTDSDIRIIYNHAVDNNKQLSQTIGLLNAMEMMCNTGTAEDVMPEGYGEFGLDITNPVPIHGVPQNEVYLRKLRLSDGSKISWKRIGSCNAPNIEHIIDRYEICDQLGNKVCNLYLCPYNRKTSNKVPKGFIFEGQKPSVAAPLNKSLQGKILPSKGVSYATDDNGEPLLVFYRSSSKVFVNKRTSNDSVGYFLNIRRPLLLDVTGMDKIDIPPMPSECDGIILKGYGINISTGFIVRDFQSQTMEIPLGDSNLSKSPATSSNEAYLLLFSASWCGPSKRFVKEINEAGINSYTYIDVEQEGTEDLQEKYNVRSIPMTFLVKTNGDIIHKWVGYDDEDPGQTQFVNYIRTCGYNIIPYNGEKL